MALSLSSLPEAFARRTEFEYRFSGMEINSILPLGLAATLRSSGMARILLSMSLSRSILRASKEARENAERYQSRETGRAGTGLYSSARIFPSFTASRARARDEDPLRARFRTAKETDSVFAIDLCRRVQVRA